ncbi:neutral/alkaline non-lysosomal ceramidase N-terminal domain-containing protein [Bryocella elongata]|uniref:neutral/alkaline non-lysosomal ceramidase N-terminal domain-containing protein n=1 Tax=Bryocella elongata TaxID=863522 RepID=UPI000CDE60C8|nr:neutral/alkaline non-lysosomal ceramidase N-terminal domain-containing protein [Bryocella elongata]
MQADRTVWEIGVAQRVVTPSLGSQMAGFDARKGVAESVHDDLHARALALTAGDRTALLVSVEVIAVSAAFSAAVRQRVREATGVPESHIVLSATHTHCGPVTLNHFFNQGQALDDGYLAKLADGVVEAAVAAYGERRARTLRVGLAPAEGIAKNRRTADELPIDPFAGVLLVEELDGRTVAIAVNYACHTTCLGPDTLSLTQDFPFYTLEKLRAELGSDVMAMFFNGAEGDLSIGHKSDLSAVGVVDSFRTFATAKTLGERLADAVLEVLPTCAAELAEIAVIRREVALPLKSYAPLAAMTERKIETKAAIDVDAPLLEQVKSKQQYLFARIEEYYARLYEESVAAEPKALAVEMIALRLGSTVFVSLPGEVFVRISLAIRERSPFARTLFLGLANDYIGYVPDEQANATIGYEVVAARVTTAASEVMEQAAVEMLEGLSEAKQRENAA